MSSPISTTTQSIASSHDSGGSEHESTSPSSTRARATSSSSSTTSSSPYEAPWWPATLLPLPDDLLTRPPPPPPEPIVTRSRSTVSELPSLSGSYDADDNALTLATTPPDHAMHTSPRATNTTTSSTTSTTSTATPATISPSTSPTTASSIKRKMPMLNALFAVGSFVEVPEARLQAVNTIHTPNEIYKEYTFELQIHTIVVSLTARYRKFREMHLKLQELSEIPLPTFPAKRYISKVTNPDIDRSRELLAYFSQLIRNADILQCRYFHDMLQLDTESASVVSRAGAKLAKMKRTKPRVVISLLSEDEHAELESRPSGHAESSDTHEQSSMTRSTEEQIVSNMSTLMIRPEDRQWSQRFHVPPRGSVEPYAPILVYPNGVRFVTGYCFWNRSQSPINGADGLVWFMVKSGIRAQDCILTKISNCSGVQLMSIREEERLGARRYEIHRFCYPTHDRSKCQCFSRESTTLETPFSVADAVPCVHPVRELICTINQTVVPGSFAHSVRITLGGGRTIKQTGDWMTVLALYDGDVKMATIIPERVNELQLDNYAIEISDGADVLLYLSLALCLEFITASWKKSS